MTSILDKILHAKRAHIAEHSKHKPFAEMDKQARAAPPPRGFAKALQAKVNAGGIGLIAEIKKASPSAGLIRPDFSPEALAKAYQAGGAACLSVLTDAPFFRGCNEDLIAARGACGLPVLRKDFILDKWQVAEARAIGADCILLIMAALDDETAKALHAAATGYGMDVLIEVHNWEELHRALKLPTGIIGINNRNLNTLDVDLKITEEFIPDVPSNRLAVSESGISTPAEIDRLRAWGVNCFLIGESLMKQENVEEATRKLISP